MHYLDTAECATVITSYEEIPKETGVRHENFKVALHLNFPDQEVAIGRTLSAKGRTELCSFLKENLDIFAWQPSDMKGVTNIKENDKIKAKTGQNQARNGKRGKVNQVKAKVKFKPVKTRHGFGKRAKNQSRRHKYLIGPARTRPNGPGQPNMLKNPPSKHLVSEELELDKQELGKLEVRKPGGDKQEREKNQVVEFDLTSSEDDRWYFLGVGVGVGFEVLAARAAYESKVNARKMVRNLVIFGKKKWKVLLDVSEKKRFSVGGFILGRGNRGLCMVMMIGMWDVG
nr:hypothetical protein [Tanacetum cinerariifolium]